MKERGSTKRNEIEVFITDFNSRLHAKKILQELESSFPELKINLDLNKSEVSYPCGHSVLRVEGTGILRNRISAKMTSLGFQCDVLIDRVCH